MEPWQRHCARTMLGDTIRNLHGEAFEDFFHRLMQLGDPGFFPVRTVRGDLGADGLTISDRKLYACYGPQTANEAEVRRKFRGDLAKAVANRGGDFDVFVFVHNNLRGVGPEVTREMSAARTPTRHCASSTSVSTGCSVSSADWRTRTSRTSSAPSH
ncbi:hypothetical protein [Nocardiopsis sp. NPDC057823]|uniref:hypothetical protein n=1 Tax=Nocardiopsis sp. NPDC057823 TaxID=3346256 RepID=UPI00366DC91D